MQHVILRNSDPEVDTFDSVGIREPAVAVQPVIVAYFIGDYFKLSSNIALICMPAQPSPPEETLALTRVRSFPGLRALAWSGDRLYAAAGYQLLRADISHSPRDFTWEKVARFRPTFRRRLSAANRLTARLFRDGFHALAALPSGGLVAAVPGAIISLPVDEAEFRVTHAITRGTRPLHITAVPSGAVYWGEYFDNPDRDEVHIYASTDDGLTWAVAYTFPRPAIRHVHNIVYDAWGNCLWILTGDYDDECRILRAACDFGQVETILQGNQQARAVALVPTQEGLYFSTDTPLETNFIYRLDRDGTLSRLAEIGSSSIYGCRVGDRVFFSTMIEPSAVNRDRYVRIFGSSSTNRSEARNWNSLLAWKKDFWSMKFFQYGNAFLPDGANKTPYLAVSTIAVTPNDRTSNDQTTNDQTTEIYSVES